MVRTTVDLPEDLHRRARAIARDTSRSLSATIADLIRRGLAAEPRSDVARSARTGLPVIRLGTVVTTEDVRALQDDEVDGAGGAGGAGEVGEADEADEA